MQRIKKFGTFGGVFTPSLLTILGVIMYLRLGWIVGQAGIIYTVGIILIAHVISITTGLSLSSIATDKKIKAGGIYYVLSRSLGLPFGGAIGATMYFATALSISLYLIGFAESFVAIDVVRNYLNLEQNIDTYRLVATSMAVLLTIIAFVSTSLAIKVQYLILTAIGLSLFSIFAGVFLNSGLNPIVPSITPTATAPSIDVLFAIFFPAVTGFTVGVAMSGDLKNSKTSIPRGTLLAIFTGLIIYLSLAIGFGLFIDRDLLLNDSAFLLKVAFIPLLVIAGIWGATLSSALGGILGGPRIIQAMAKDKLAPGLLKRGFGINNEPRFAIITTFLIALAGILIGDLNTIARVVSMFYITAYGFINLAFALESWASSDFRPSFRIPRWVGWIGFAASFIVMMQIDLLAMIIAFMLLWIVWYVMKRREQGLSTDNVWQSVWTSVVRQTLHQMNVKDIEERNWKPNIILFSGNPQTRPHLIELGKALISNHGLLTLINLKLYKKGQKPQPRTRQNITETGLPNGKGIFNREYYCKDFYDGIENIAETYGFAGVEPNTVLMGWAHQNTDAVRFGKLIKHIIDLDLNILLMEYDQQQGFGKRKTIDIWWRGSGNNGNLAINLVKFLWLSNEWKDSKTRLMIENPVNDERENIYAFATEVLDNLRINAQIVIINNEIEQRPFYDIIRAESGASDIVFLGLPEIEDGEETDFIENTHALCRDLGTVVLIKASTQFKRLNIGLKSKPLSELTLLTPDGEKTSYEYQQSIKWPRIPEASSFMKHYYDQTNEFIHEAEAKSFNKILKQYFDIVLGAENRVNSTFSIIEKKMDHRDPVERRNNLTTLFKLTNNTFIRYEQILNHIKNNLADEQQKNLEIFLKEYKSNVKKFHYNLPKTIILPIPSNQLLPDSNDSFLLKFYKWRKRNSGKKQISQKVNIRKLLRRYYPVTFHAIFQKSWQRFSDLSLQYLDQQQLTFKQFRDSLQIIEKAISNGKFTDKILQDEKQKIQAAFNALKEFLIGTDSILRQIAEQKNHKAIQDICNALDHTHVNQVIKKYKPSERINNHQLKQMETYPQQWKSIIGFRVNYNLLELILKTTEYKLWHHMERASEELREIPENTRQNTSPVVLEKLISFCTKCQEQLVQNKPLPDPGYKIESKEHTHSKIKEIEEFSLAKIGAATNNLPVRIDLLKNPINGQAEILRNSHSETDEVEVSRLINFILQSDLITPMQQLVRNYGNQLTSLEKEVWETDRLIMFTLTGDKEDVLPMPPPEFFNDQKQRIIGIGDKVENLKVSLDDKFHSIINNTSRQLSIPVFLKTAENLKLYARKADQDIVKESWIRLQARKVKDYLRKHLVRLWFDRSKRLIYVQKLQREESEGLFPVSQLHRLNESVSVKDSILARIPPYYQHLFLRKNNYFLDFWHGKPDEIEEASRTIARHDRGFNGALMIRGEHNSGKSFFANYISQSFLSSRQVYTLQAPFSGSVSEKDFLSAMQKATDKTGDLESIIKSFPEKSVLLIEDLELWWEKTQDGTNVIKLLCDLIERFGDRIFFIVTINLHAFNSMNRIEPISPYLLNTIDCNPFNAEEIKNIIMQRHKSGNISFRLGDTKEYEMRTWDFARLFNTYYNYSRGNIGLCLQTWMACITGFKNDTLMIQTPNKPDTSVLSKLDAETLIFMVQFIMHKRLTIEKISRILLITPDAAKEKIMLLKRAALVTEPNPGVFIINPNIHPFIREKLLEKDLL
jgi:amino acid transporter